MGPVLGQDFSHSNKIIQDMLTGKMPLLLPLAFDYVDVRDVADLHLLAMTHPNAAGQRFLATTGENINYQQEAKILKEGLGQAANRVSTFVAPAWLIKVLALFRKDLKMPATFLGQSTACSYLVGNRSQPAKQFSLPPKQCSTWDCWETKTSQRLKDTCLTARISRWRCWWLLVYRRQ